MHRARHMSLDYLGSSSNNNNSSAARARGSEDWSQFLSTSMAALATDDHDDRRADAPAVTHDRAPRTHEDESDDLFAQHQQALMHAAVAVATSPRARASPSHKTEMKIDTFGLEPHPTLLSAQTDEFMMLGLSGKPRSDSISEALTSSTESSPSASAWRPLGRRMTPQGSNSASSSSASNNQLDHLYEIPALGGNSGSSGALDAPPASKKLLHTSSFRDIVHLSSSGSSYESSSSSSDEEPLEPPSQLGSTAKKDELKTTPFRMMMRKGSAPVLSMRPSIIDVDPSFAESSLTVLTSLPAHPRSLSIDNTFVGTHHHVKSPVLGTRKDSQTWQLQDEEFLKTSPRFGALSSDMSVFGNAALLADELTNQMHESEPRPRFTKDMRASSVDFTYSSSSSSRLGDVNPPLPPAPEPMQRLRAKSFSYSSGYGASGYANASGYSANGSSNSTSGKQYAAHHQHHPHQPTLHDYHGNMRGFHHPSASPPPVTSPPPQSGGIRPPRVSIPSDSPMHQYSHHQHHQHQHQQHQYGPPQYRRYSSDTFAAVPPYPDMYNPEQENQGRHGNTGRGMRSYSMETSGFGAGTRPFRSQSMEGPQLFAAAPPLEYPTMTRTSSAGMGYDGWPRGPMDVGGVAPPLPPDSRGGSSSNMHSVSHHYPSPPPEAYYEVEFKRGRLEIFAGNATYNAGDYVKVEADRGEDIGRIVQRSTDLAKLQSSGSNSDPASPGDEPVSRSKRHDAPVKKIIAVANQREREMLAEQRKEEHEVFEVCKSKVRQRLLPMNVIDAEYQFDRHKLTFFFEADRRIDFRELVRDLFAIYKTRIWLQQVVPSGGKKVTVEYDTN